MNTCLLCGLPTVGRERYCSGPAPGALAITCRQFNTQRLCKEKNARVRKQGAALGGGLGSDNKALSKRLDKFTVLSRSDVAKLMCCSKESIRVTELRALEKVRKGLMPFTNATSGATKVRQVTKPIPSLAD